jgi:hypothetical protein
VNNPYARLSERIHGEVTDLDRIVQRALSAWVRLKSEPEQMDVCLDSVALNLHAFGNFLAALALETDSP